MCSDGPGCVAQIGSSRFEGIGETESGVLGWVDHFCWIPVCWLVIRQLCCPIVGECVVPSGEKEKSASLWPLFVSSKFMWSIASAGDQIPSAVWPCEQTPPPPIQNLTRLSRSWAEKELGHLEWECWGWPRPSTTEFVRIAHAEEGDLNDGGRKELKGSPFLGETCLLVGTARWSLLCRGIFSKLSSTDCDKLRVCVLPYTPSERSCDWDVVCKTVPPRSPRGRLMMFAGLVLTLTSWRWSLDRTEDERPYLCSFGAWLVMCSRGASRLKYTEQGIWDLWSCF